MCLPQCPKQMNQYNPHIHHRKSIRLQGYDYSQAGLYFITVCCEGREHRFGTVENGEMILNEFGTVAYNEWAKLAERFPNFELDVFQIMPNHMHGIIALAVAQNNTHENNVGAGFTPAQNTTPAPIVGAGFTPALNENGQPDNNKGQPVVAGFTPAANDDKQNNKGQPQGLPLRVTGHDNGATARVAPTIGDIVGAYKSLVTNACIDICNSKNIRLGKLWQRNYHEHIIRDEQSYQTISKYIINNPKNWKDDKFYTE